MPSFPIVFLRAAAFAALAGTHVLGIAATSMASGAPPKTREPWMTSRIVGTPEPPPPYQAAVVFPHLTFDSPVDIVLGPDRARLFVVQRRGKIWSFDPREPQPQLSVFADLAPLFPGLPRLEFYSLAFHPRFETTREVFIRARLTQDSPDGAQVLRFKVPPREPLAIDPASVETTLAFQSGGHSGGNILFGPDGYLYITSGDAGPASPPDPRDTGQSLDDLLSAILRIDVDRREGDRRYAIPADNPFVDLPGARGEIWAYGLRNPWKIAFRPGTAELWAGDVGWELWEMVYRIERGGNYGWSITEGPQPVKPNSRRGPTPILPAVVLHPHTEAASITGGFFYTGTRLPELQGAYIYGDYVTGRIWALRHDGTKVTGHRELARTSAMIATFGVGGDGELYFADFARGGGLLRLEPNTSRHETREFPRRLSDTGLFADTARQTPNPGVVPYTIRASQWVDGATAEHWIAMPGSEPARLADERRGPTHRLRATVRVGSVFARTLSLELEAGNPASRRRIETRVLHFAGIDWKAYTYRWNDAQTDADLVPADGYATTFTLRDLAAPGGTRTLAWRFPHQAECLRCHNADSGRVLGFIPGNLDVALLQDAGVVEAAFAAAAARVPLAALDDPHASLELRARSWLHVNCAHCHRHQGGGSGVFRVNIEAAADNTLLETAPLQGDFGIPDARLIDPGAPERSVLLYRVAKSGPGRMPQFGATTTDVRALHVLWQWIAGSREEGRTPVLGAGNTLDHPIHGLLAVHRADDPATAPEERERLVAAGLASSSAEVRALFERFVPDAERTPVLGANFDPAAVLSLRGDPARGRTVLTEAGCLACHLFVDTGRDMGPDLTGIGARFTPAELLESIVLPSKSIAPEYAARSFELGDGAAQLGFVRERTPAAITLRTVAGETVVFPTANVRSETALPVSLMPEGLLGSLTAQQAADLLAALAPVAPGK